MGADFVGADLGLLSLDVVTISCALLIGVRMVGSYPRHPQSWIALFLCIAVAAHVALARAEYGPWMPAPYRFGFGVAAPFLDVVRNMAPPAFALLAWLLFTENRRIPQWLVGLTTLQLGVEVAPQLLGPDATFDAVSALLHLVFSVLAVLWTVAYWRADLVEARRRTRALLTIVLAVDGVVTSVLLRLVIPSESYANYLAHVVLTALTGFIVVFVMLRMMDGDVGPYLGAPTAPPPSATEAREQEDDLALTRLERLLAGHKVYLEPGLTVAALALRVGTPEYRLRRLIHERMGFRNFNSFLHSYRVREAAEQLADPNLQRMPILTIALSCGYGSVNTFNRGFREVMGSNPSEYRARQLRPAHAGETAPESA
jgi:AraC-like DNA-binding protein